MKKFTACICCAAIVLSMAAANVTAYAAQADNAAGAAVTQEVSGETLNSYGFTFVLSKERGNNVATITGFNQGYYADEGSNKDYNRNHTLIIPVEVEGNNGEKYTVTAISIDDNSWKDGKEASTFTKVFIPKAVTSVGRTFSHLEKLEYIELEEGSQLTSFSFNDCTNLIRVGIGSTCALPSGIETIPNGSFSNCKSLKSIILPEGLKNIGSNDDRVYILGEYVFGGPFIGCESLSEIVIPESVECVAATSFKDCTGLETVKFEVSKSGENIGKSKLRYLGVEQTWFIQFTYNEYGAGVFQNCTNLKNIVLPKSVNEYAIGESCFRDSGLESITLTSSVTSISRRAFEGSSLKSLNVPDSCKSVGVSAFAGTKLGENNLSTPKGEKYGISFLNKTIDIDENAFRTANWSRLEGKLISFNDDQIKVTIAGYDNSNVKEYVYNHKMDMYFVPLGDWNPLKMPGDCNADGKVNARDILTIKQYLCGWNVGDDINALDANGDGKVNLRDAVHLQMYLNGWNVTLN